MLVLSRKIGETIKVGEVVSLTILSIKGRQVRLGIEAPKNLPIHREEIYQRLIQENPSTAASTSPAEADHAMAKEFLESRLGIEASETNIRLLMAYIHAFETEITQAKKPTKKKTEIFTSNYALNQQWRDANWCL